MLPEDPLTEHYAREESATATEVEIIDDDGVEGDGEEPTTSGQQADGEEDDGDDSDENGMNRSWYAGCKSLLIFLTLGNRYNLLNCLRNLKPSHIILYNVDIAATRMIEVG